MSFKVIHSVNIVYDKSFQDTDTYFPVKLVCKTKQLSGAI